MTTEPTTDEARGAINDPALFAYIQIPVPGIPYSAVRIPFLDDADDFQWYLDSLQIFREAYLRAFPPQEAAERPQNGRPQSGAAQRSQGRSRPARHGSGNDYGVTLLCPEHDEELRPSLRNKEMDWDDELGREIPASWYHPHGTGTHTVYQSKAVRA